MDDIRGFDENRIDDGDEADALTEAKVEIGSDERRMHVRAYNHWVSLLRGRAYPSIDDLDPAAIADFGAHGVLLDFSRGIADPAIAFLGRSLREECDLDPSVTMISQVPSRSLLSRLTDHYLQIIANRAPIGFEAEFTSSRGHNTMYRGILLPFSSDEDTIDFIYGVINWKELVDAETQARLDAEVAAAVRSTPRAAPTAPVWADGPGAGRDGADRGDGEARLAAGLADRLVIAQQAAAEVHAADRRPHAALYRALGLAYDFAAAADRDPQGYEALLGRAGIAVQLRAPMTPIIQLVFGAAYDEARMADYATVLSHARRRGVADGALGDFLASFTGGIADVVGAERALRQAAAQPAVDCRALLADRPVLADVAIDTDVAAGDYVVLLARAGAPGTVAVVAAIGDAALTERAMRAAL